MIYRVMVWETVGGYVDVDTEDFEPVEGVDVTSVKTADDADEYVNELIVFHGAEKFDDVTHREVQTCGVDIL